MSLISLWTRIFAAALAVLLSTCGGGGSSAAAPTGFTGKAGGGQVVLTWDTVPGVTYWLMYAPSTSALDMKSPPANHVWIQPVTSPYTLSGLIDGVSYSFVINGRNNGGPGGPQSAAWIGVPRPASGAQDNWFAQPAQGSADLRGVSYGLASDLAYKYVAVGSAGAVYRGLDLIDTNPANTNTYGLDTVSWTSVALTAPTGTGARLPDFKASLYALGQYFAVGTAGSDGSQPVNVYQSADAITWTAASTHLAGLNALASNGYAVVGVGDGGLVAIYSASAGWTSATFSSAPDFKAIAYSPQGYWVAVGTGGAVWSSPDAVSWTSQTSGVSVTLNGVGVSSAGLLVAVGDNGTIISCPDVVAGLWTVNSNPAHPENLYTVNADYWQFMVTGAGGRIYTAVNPISVVSGAWAPTTTSTWTSYVAAAANGNIYGVYGNSTRYVAVGAAGLNLLGE